MTLAFVIGALASPILAQERRSERVAAALTDAVYSIAFSPDSRTLAIARGSRDDYRVEIWDTQTGTLRRSIRGFDGTVSSVSFAADSRTLVTGSSGIHIEKVAAKPTSSDGKHFTELKWWDTETGDLKQRLELPDEDIVGVTAIHSPDGLLLATVENRAVSHFMYESGGPFGLFSPTFSTPTRRMDFYDASLKLLDAKTGEVRLKLKDGFLPLYDVVTRFSTRRRSPPLVFSPDGQLVAAWNSREIRIWRTATGDEVHKLKSFKGRLSAATFSPDGQTIAAAITKYSIKNDRMDFNSEIRTWDLATGAAKQVLPLSTPSVFSIAFALSGQQVLIGGMEPGDNRWFATMEIADLQTGTLGTLMAKDEGKSSSIVLSPNGAMVAFQTDTTTVRLVNTFDWKIRYTCDESSDAGPNAPVSRRFLLSVKSVGAIGFAADGKTLTGEIEQGGIKFWDVRTGEVKRVLAEQDDTGSMVSISTYGSNLAEVSSDETVRVWSTERGEHWSASEGAEVATIALSGDGEWLAVAYPHRIAIFDNKLRKRVRTIEDIQGKVTSLALSGDGQTLASVTEQGLLNLYDTRTATLTQSISTGPGISVLRFGPGERLVAAGGKDGRVDLWDTQSGSLVFEVKKHSAIVNALSFSPDGRLLASGSDDRTAIIWEIGNGKSRRTFKGHDVTVSSLAFSPDGNRLAAGSGNASVVLWDVLTGKLDRVLK